MIASVAGEKGAAAILVPQVVIPAALVVALCL